MLHRDFFSRTHEDEDTGSAAYLCFLLALVAASSVSLVSSIRTRLKIMKAVDEVRRTMPELRFASQLYIREHAGEEEREAFLRSKGKRRLFH